MRPAPSRRTGDMSAPLRDLLPYVPASLLRRVVTKGGVGERRFDGAVLFADVTGFTSLTERLGSRGPRGAEALTEILNAYFDAVIEAIAAHGGEVAKFAGDATLAVWPGETGTRALHAVRCAVDVQGALVRVAAIADEQLRVRVGVAAGRLWAGTVGGVGGRREFLMGGLPIGEAAAAAAGTAPGTVAVSAGGWPLVRDWCAGGEEQAGGRLVREVRGTSSSQPAMTGEGVALTDDLLRAFVPRAITARITAGQAGWLAEFRRVSVAFVNIGGVDYDRGYTGPAADAAVRALQEVVYRYEGSVNQVVVDDKGTTLVAAWGLPSLTHEDDAARAVEAAVSMRDALAARGLHGAVGVATGLAFTGHRGNARRREYAMIGDVMNLAARLMAAAGDGVLCDEATARAAAGRRGFEATAPVRLKGKAAAVQAYRPGVIGGVRTRSATEIVGRAAERGRLEEGLTELSSQGRGGVMLLEGEAGMGKSLLLSHLLQQAGASGVRCLHGEADAIEKATPYFVWRRAMAGLLNGVGRGDADLLREAVREALADDASLAAWAPLLNALLPLDLPENEVTAQMESQGRADGLRDLTVHLLRRAADRQPTVLVLDDAHWIDSASWGLTAAAVQRVPSLLVVLATRPMPEPLPPDYRQLLRAAGSRRLTLSPMPAAEALALVARRLGVEQVPPAVGRLVAQKAEGNPFFAEQLALDLRDAGHLVIEDGRCWLATEATSLDALNLPDTVQGVITGRIDRLSPTEQLTVKVASVIGRVFGLRLLTAVHPVQADRATLPQQLAQLERLDLTVLESPEPDLAYLFKHVITQEVAYNLLAFARRRDLHRAVADWHERTHAADRAPYLPLLAHHWTRAEEWSRAVDCLEQAGEQALGSHANEEAIRFYGEALEVVARGDVRAEGRRRSRWEWGIGVALIKLSRYREAHGHLVESLRLLGRPAPRTRVGLALSTVGQLLRQVAHRTLPAVGRRPGPAARAEVLQAADIQQRLTEVAYWNNDFGALVHAILSCVNLADRGGPSKELITAFGTMGFLSGLAGLHRVAGAYRRWSRAVGDEVGHQDAIAYAAELEAVYFGAMGLWADAYEAADRGSAMFERLGDRMRWHTCFSLRGYFLLHQGDFERARPIFEEGLRIAGPGGAVQARLWSLAALLATQLARDAVDDDAVTALEDLVRQRVHHSDAILAHGLLAQAKHRRGDTDGALAHAAAATPLIDVFPPASWHTFLGNAAVAELYLALAEQGEGDARDRMHRARRGIRGLARFARMNPPARGRASLYRGRYLWLRGRRRAARRAWSRALTLAERLDMPYEAGLAHLELGRRPSPTGSRQHLDHAAAILRRLDARHDLERARRFTSDASAS
jgi:class 3 adenylate cyclase/tetratricopeptide (TPR) repeat protein